MSDKRFSFEELADKCTALKLGDDTLAFLYYDPKDNAVAITVYDDPGFDAYISVVTQRNVKLHRATNIESRQYVKHPIPKAFEGGPR